MLAGFDRLRNEALVVLLAHLLGMIGEPDVEVGLEDEVNRFGIIPQPTMPRTRRSSILSGPSFKRLAETPRKPSYDELIR